MEYKDYREKITNIISIMDDSQPSLQLGAITIQNILNESKIEESSDKTPDSTKEKTVTPNTESKKEKILKRLNTTIPTDQLYVVERLLIGANLISLNEIDKPDPKSFHYQEAPIRKYNLNDHDIIHAEKLRDGFDLPYIIKKVEASNQPKTITEFKYGIPEFDLDNNQYYIEKNYQNEYLSDYNSEMDRFYIPLNHPFSVQNTLIDLAWYNNNPSNIKIRWTTYSEPNNSEYYTNQHTYSKPKNPTPPTEKATLDFDLQQKQVAIIIGEQQREAEYKELVEEHNGKCIVLDGFRVSERNSYYESNIKNSDIVINVQNQAKHTNISNVIDIVKDYDLKYAIANGGGIQQVERAIYRALNNLPAYELSTTDIDYPIK